MFKFEPAFLGRMQAGEVDVFKFERSREQTRFHLNSLKNIII